MPPVLIIAHGQPSDPAPAAAELSDLAAQVARLLGGRWVQAATLAEPGALSRMASLAPGAGLVFPMFMAGGWFTRVNLPAKLRAAGAEGWQVLEPFGCDPAVHDLAVDLAEQAVPEGGELLLAAHGSFKTSVPSDIAHHVAAKIGKRLGLSRSEAAFIEQVPQLEQVRGYSDQAVCLPFFAAGGDHVTRDVPAALAKAGFQGRILPSLGRNAQVSALIAAAIERAEPVCQMECRFRR